MIGRFIGVARAITPFLAGTSHLPYRRFLLSTSSAPRPGQPPSWASATWSRRALDRVAELSHSIGLGIGAAAVAGALALGLRHLCPHGPAR